MLTSPLRTSVLYSKHPPVLKATSLGSLAKQLIGASRAPIEVLAGSWFFRRARTISLENGAITRVFLDWMYVMKAAMLHYDTLV